MKKTLTNGTLDFKSTVIFQHTSGFARFSLSKSRCGIKTYEYKVGHWEAGLYDPFRTLLFYLGIPPDAAAILTAAGVVRTVSYKRKVRSLRCHFDPADLASLKFIPHQRIGGKSLACVCISLNTLRHSLTPCISYKLAFLNVFKLRKFLYVEVELCIYYLD